MGPKYWGSSKYSGRAGFNPWITPHYFICFMDAGPQQTLSCTCKSIGLCFFNTPRHCSHLPKAPFSCPLRCARLQRRALLPGTGFSTPSTNAKEGEEEVRRKWEAERGTWPDFQRCGINVHLSKSCASAKPLPGGYLKIGCGGPTSHPPCKFYAPNCLVKATPDRRCCSSHGSSLHPQSITRRAAASQVWDPFPFPALSISLNGLFTALVWDVLSGSTLPNGSGLANSQED